jgi:hypothetical protein
MSGPKVVRIVTREEVIAICLGQIARLDAAIAAWTRVGQQNDCVSDADIAAVAARRDRLASMIAADRFLDLQKAAPIEIAFLRDDLESRLARVAEAAALARTTGRRRTEAAAALIAALKRAGLTPPPDLARALAGAAAGQDDPKALSAGFALLSSQPDAGDAARRALAARHNDGTAPLSLAAWIDAQPPSPADALVRCLEQRLAELSLLAGPATAAPLEQRLHACLTASDDARQGLLFDSLEMDLARAVSSARADAAAKDAIGLALAELAQVGSPKLDTLTARRNTAGSAALLADIQVALAETREAAAAVARRDAVLRSLAGLGYEVTEGLSTAWVQAGKVVLRKAAAPDYGVEISGDPAAARMQMRAVAFTGGGIGPDPARDKDAETIWCGDVTALQTQLAVAGGGLVIEKALAIGATPLKRMAAPAEALGREAREGPAGSARTVR